MNRMALLTGAAAILCGVSSARAGIPALTINWWVNGELVGSWEPVGVDNGNGTYGYSGFRIDDPFFGGTGATLSYTITGDPDPLLSGNLVVQSPSNQTIETVLEVILPISETFGAGTELAGSAALGLTTDSGGGSLTSIGGFAVWQGILDGIAVGPTASLFFDPFAITHSGSQSSGVSDDFGLDGGMIPGPNAFQSIGIRIGFRLTPNDQASITSVFFVIPGPGGLVVLVGGLFATGRRRRRAF
jgi:hypothetical protein